MRFQAGARMAAAALASAAPPAQTGAPVSTLPLAAAIPAARAPEAGVREPSLHEAQQAAMRTAAGSASDDAARAARARASRWAPVLRAQGGLRDDQRSRRGEFRLAPLLEDDAGTSRTWAVVLQWDFAQLVYSHDEAQLALAHVHLARVRQQAAAEAARLYEERFRRRAQLGALGPARTPQLAEAVLALLRATAQLDALTSGLFRRQLEEAEARLDELGPPGSALPAAAAADPPAAADSPRPPSAPAETQAASPDANAADEEIP